MLANRFLSILRTVTPAEHRLKEARVPLAGLSGLFTSSDGKGRTRAERKALRSGLNTM